MCYEVNDYVVTVRGQPERSHLFAVADEQHIADEHRVIPCLALERRHPRDLRELSGVADTSASSPSSDSTSKRFWSANRTSWPCP